MYDNTLMANATGMTSRMTTLGEGKLRLPVLTSDDSISIRNFSSWTFVLFRVKVFPRRLSGTRLNKVVKRQHYQPKRDINGLRIDNYLD